jgi:hypothetical protein
MAACLFAGSVLLAPIASAQPARLEHVDCTATPAAIRVTVRATGAFIYTANSLSGPPRVYADLLQVSPSQSGTETVACKDGRVGLIRISRHAGGTRLTVVLANPAPFHHTLSADKRSLTLEIEAAAPPVAVDAPPRPAAPPPTPRAADVPRACQLPAIAEDLVSVAPDVRLIPEKPDDMLDLIKFHDGFIGFGNPDDSQVALYLFRAADGSEVPLPRGLASLERFYAFGFQEEENSVVSDLRAQHKIPARLIAYVVLPAAAQPPIHAEIRRYAAQCGKPGQVVRATFAFSSTASSGVVMRRLSVAEPH